jgi:TatD DNase family protein
MLTGMSLADIPSNLSICQSRPKQCYMTIGVHPYHAAEPVDDSSYLARLATHVREAVALQPTSLAAFGELGLDYDRTTSASPEIQRWTFTAQLDLFVAEGWNARLPLFLHCRGAFDDFVAVVRPYLGQLPRRGLVHSFVGTAEQSRVLTEELGFDVSVNGFSFQTRESLDMVVATPLEHLQIETDAPWGEIKASSEVARRYLANAKPLPTAKKRDKWDAGAMVKERNESCAMERVAFVVAGLKGITVEEVADATWRNSIRMFGLDEESPA